MKPLELVGTCRVFIGAKEGKREGIEAKKMIFGVVPPKTTVWVLS